MNRNNCDAHGDTRDCGGQPLVCNIDRATEQNENFRTALWTGEYCQLTLMCIAPGGEIGLEMHADTDQFIRIECGCGIVKMGDWRERLYMQQRVNASSGILIPAGTWHNLINTGGTPLKLCSVYAPPQHPFGTTEILPDCKRDCE